MDSSGDTSLAIQHCLDRLDDNQPTVRDELIGRSQHRLRVLVRFLLGGFSRLRRWEDSDDVLQAALLKLHASLIEVRPPTVRDFFGLAAAQVRRVLIDLARHHFGPQGAAGKYESPPGGELASSWLVQAENPRDWLSLDDWTEFHDRVASLPDELRETFELLFYHGLTQLAAAELLHVSEKTVRRRWYKARALLANSQLPGDESP
jgi:RNA polymerase sigma-70 factor (ECF subfamily)